MAEILASAPAASEAAGGATLTVVVTAAIEATADVSSGGAKAMAFLGARPKNALFSSQRHLSSMRSEVTLNLREVWNAYKGAGVKMSVIDDDFDYHHTALHANYNINIDRNFVGHGDSDAIHEFDNWHGTAVMGVVGADDNGVGVVGVAPDAILMGLRIGFRAAGNPA